MHIGSSTSIRGLSRKYPDREAVSGCRRHHEEHHRGTKTFWTIHPEYDRDKMIYGLNRIYDMKQMKSFDIEENRERFKFNLESYVLGREVVGVVVDKGRIEIHLNGDKRIAFQVAGDEIQVIIDLPPNEIPTGVVQ